MPDVNDNPGGKPRSRIERILRREVQDDDGRAQPSDETLDSRRRVDRRALRLSRDIAAQQFAAFYIEAGFNATSAYLRIRPDTDLRKARSIGARWVLDRRVRDAIARLVGPSMNRAQRAFDQMLAQLEAEMSADLFEFIEEGAIPVVVAGQGIEYVNGIRYKIDPADANLLRRRAVREIVVKNGQVERIKLADPAQARTQFMAVLDRLTQIQAGAKSKDAGLSRTLQARIAKAKEIQAVAAKKLPLPPNVSEFRVIDGEVIPRGKAGNA